MVEIVLVDTSFFFAYYNSEDSHHDSARNYFDNVVNPQTHPLGFLLTDYIFDELITLILIRTKNKTQAIFTGNSILNSQTLKVIYLKEETISKAWATNIPMDVPKISPSPRSLKEKTMEFNILYKKKNDWFIGHIQEYPDYESQGRNLDELRENLIEIYNDINQGLVPDAEPFHLMEVAI
jgi:predicted nucleic acid-binding protein